MSIKTTLNNLISKMVTRKRVLKATQCSEMDFDAMLMEYFEVHMKDPKDNYYDGIDAFIRDFRKEGWCKEEILTRDCNCILSTLFHLNERINEYALYWF